MNVSSLYGRHDGEDIYIVGSGASLSLVPYHWFSGRVCIGVRDAWKFADVRYCISDRISDYWDYRGPRDVEWIIKETSPLHVNPADYRFYVFSTDRLAGREECFLHDTGNTLYFAGGLHNTAINLACRMGAKAIYLVGVDNTDFDDRAAAKLAWFSLLKVRKLAGEIGVPLLTVTPFLGLGCYEEEFDILREENDNCSVSDGAVA